MKLMGICPKPMETSQAMPTLQKVHLVPLDCVISSAPLSIVPIDLCMLLDNSSQKSSYGRVGTPSSK